jgi:hypothetical protein
MHPKQPGPKPPTISGRNMSEKIIRRIGELAFKEIAAPIIALALAYAGGNYVNKRIQTWGGADTVNSDITDTKTKIEHIRQRQKNMGGPIPEWWDRVVVKGNITSSVNALEAKLKLLEAKKVSVESIGSLVEILVIFILFVGLISYTREYIEALLSSRNKNWRESKIVDETNLELLSLHERILKLERRAEESTRIIRERNATHPGELATHIDTLRKQLGEFEEIYSDLQKIDN